jgi:hypothetical protein
MQGTTLMQTLQNSDMVQQYMWGFSPDNPGFVGILVAALIAFLIGYVEQFLSIIMIKKEKHGSFPMPLNTFYLAHDFLTGVIFLILGFMNSFFYIFMVLGIGMFIWNFTEIIDMYDYVKNNREETFRGMFFGELTAKKCVLEIVAETLAFAVFILLMIVLMDDPVFLKWFMITNILIAVCTGYYWTKNKVVWGTSKLLAIVILIGTINTFLPVGLGWWSTICPTTFDTPLFYLMGAVSVCFAVKNVYIVFKKLPEKPKMRDGKKTIW